MSMSLRTAARQRGLSLVELMVGVAIGLFVVAGATMLVSNQLGDNRRLLLETQIQQDLRAAADIVARDIRRSGYWATAASGVWHAGAVAVSANPYRTITPAGGAASAVQFSYSRGAIENDFVDVNDEAGFRLSNGAIQMRVGGTWQPLTDDKTLRITNFRMTLNPQAVPLQCLKDCPGGGTACWPTQTLRDVTVLIEGQAANDPKLQRSVRSSVRLRNDVVTGACPT